MTLGERTVPKAFLIEAAEHFERQIAKEDREHWANVYNAQNYRRCAAHIATLEADLAAARAEIERLREALEIIAGDRQCVDSLMGNVDVARAALSGGKNDGKE